MTKIRKKSILLSLVCPYCEEKLQKVFGTHEFGVLRCSCDSYPIVSSIPIIFKEDTLNHKKMVDCIYAGKHIKATWIALSSQRLTHKVIAFLSYILQKNGFTIGEKSTLFLLYLIGPSRSWFKYLLNTDRETLRTIENSLQFTNLKNKVVLDVGCGTGSFFSLLEKKVPTKKWTHIGIDKSYMSLLFAVLYHRHPSALFIQADLEVGIPLRNKTCDTVFIIDCFAWIYNKKKLIQESKDVLRKLGQLYVFNIHEESEDTKWWGYGISPNYLKKLLNQHLSFISFITTEGSLEKSPIPLSRKGYSCVAQKK